MGKMYINLLVGYWIFSKSCEFTIIFFLRKILSLMQRIIHQYLQSYLENAIERIYSERKDFI